MKYFNLTIACAVLLAIGSIATAADSPIAGVWSYTRTHLQAISYADGSEVDRVTEAVNPRLFIFTNGGHYSQVGVNGTEKRPLRAEVDEGAMGGPKLSTEQKLAEHGPLIAESGTYTIDGNVVTMRPIVDKIPDYMQGDGVGDATAEFAIDGDTMTWIRRTEAATITDTYVRIE